jgi:hypothetical protein
LNGAGSPQPEKYQELKSKIETLWPENEELERALVQMRSGDTKEKVREFINGVNHVKLITGFLIRTLDAMVEYGPQGGPGALRYDNDRFSQERSHLTDLLMKTTIDKHIDAGNALTAEATQISNRLRVIDQSLNE